jgi:hypothetical protein
MEGRFTLTSSPVWRGGLRPRVSLATVARRPFRAHTHTLSIFLRRVPLERAVRGVVGDHRASGRRLRRWRLRPAARAQDAPWLRVRAAFCLRRRGGGPLPPMPTRPSCGTSGTPGYASAKTPPTRITKQVTRCSRGPLQLRPTSSRCTSPRAQLGSSTSTGSSRTTAQASAIEGAFPGPSPRRPGETEESRARGGGAAPGAFSVVGSLGG